MLSADGHRPAAPSVRTLGPGWFALVMATGIVSTAAARQGFPRLSLGLLAVAAVSYVVLVILSLVRRPTEYDTAP